MVTPSGLFFYTCVIALKPAMTPGPSDHKKRRPGTDRRKFWMLRCCGSLLSGGDGTGGAGVEAAAAIDADIGVDGENIAFLDSTGRALGLACSASHASIS